MSLVGAEPVRMSLYERLRRAPFLSTVERSLPVLFFGDLLTARLATVGLNPSHQEYLDRDGATLVGARQRFATLDSLGADERASLSDRQCDTAIDTMRGYFGPAKPVYSWFRGLDRVAEAMGFSYQAGQAAHLDLVQEATTRVWSKLDPPELEALLQADLPFLEWEIHSFPLEVVVCTSQTVSKAVRSRLAVDVTEEGDLAHLRWWVGTAPVAGRQTFSWPVSPRGCGRSACWVQD